jgi:hypothetical protein
VAPGGDGAALAEAVTQAVELGVGWRGAWIERHDGMQARGILGDALGLDACFPLFVLGVGAGQQAAERGIAVVALGEQSHARPRGGCGLWPRSMSGRRLEWALEAELGTHDHPEPALLGCDVHAHRAVEPVAIAQRDGLEPELGRALDQLLGMGGALEKREARPAEQLCEAVHGGLNKLSVFGADARGSERGSKVVNQPR